MISNLSAANAYQNQLKLQKSMMDTAGSEESSSKPNFAQLVEDQFNDVVNTQKSAEVAKLDALTGKGDIADLVTAIANAELALNTIVTIRDKAISAYQDIIRMPI